MLVIQKRPSVFFSFVMNIINVIINESKINILMSTYSVNCLTSKCNLTLTSKNIDESKPKAKSKAEMQRIKQNVEGRKEN